VFDHDNLRLRRFGRRHLNDRRFLDRSRPSAANDRFDHLLADAGLLELGQRRRVDVEHPAIHLDQRQENLFPKTRTLEVDDVLDGDGLHGRHAQSDDDGGGSKHAANHEDPLSRWAECSNKGLGATAVPGLDSA
jgi:hypothetical protein